MRQFLKRVRLVPGSGWGPAGCLVLALLAAVAAAAGAQERPGPPRSDSGPGQAPAILRLEVEGNHNVTSAQILQWFALQPGDRFDQSRVSRALKDLTAKRRFADARVEGEEEPGGIVLHLVVQEYPLLREVRVEGADKVKEKDVRAAMRLTPGSFVGPADLGADRDKIGTLYRDKGYFRVVVQDSLVPTEDGGHKLLLRIREGEKASIQEIAFQGNAHVPAQKLRKAMETKASGLLRGGDFKPDVLQQDFDKIAAFYRTLGYLDAQVTAHDLDVAANGRDVTLRLQVVEGPRYSVGKIAWTGNHKFSDADISALMRLKAGLPFSDSDYEASTNALYELYNDAGYIHFNATPRRDVHGTVVDLTYDFDEGQPAQIGHIRIVGNTKTQDKVILREFLILPGDTFDRSRLMRSMREVYNLGFFEDASFEKFTPTPDGNVDLQFKVAERQTGQLGAGAGYSAINALTGFLEVAETNLFGTGRRLSLRWEFGKRNNEIDFSYTQPWLMDTPTSLGVDLYQRSNIGNSRVPGSVYAGVGAASISDSFWRDKRTGGALRLGRRLDFLDYTTLSWAYRAESVRLTDFATVAAGPLKDRLDLLEAQFAKGPRRTFSTALTLRRNSTDNPFFPSAGSNAELSTDLIGTFLGGDEHYLREEATLATFRKLGRSKLSLMLRSRFGLLKGLRDEVPPDYELFRLGGNRYYGVRGYDDFEIVPAGNAQFLGGRAMTIFTTELVYPFTPKVHGVAFFDAGNTWNSFREADLSLLRQGAGLGVRVEVPMVGQLGLDYGYGFDRFDSQGRSRNRWQLHFNFGSLF